MAAQENAAGAPAPEIASPHSTAVRQQARGPVQGGDWLRDGLCDPLQSGLVDPLREPRARPAVQLKAGGGPPSARDAGGERAALSGGTRGAVALEPTPPCSGRRLSTLQMFVIQLFRMTGNQPVGVSAAPGQAIGAALLPAHTRIKIRTMDLIGLHGDNHGPGQWIEIEVTTGPYLGTTGWVTAGGLEMADQPETTQVDLAAATQLFNELRGARFTSSNGQEANIPFSYPIDGCYARAHRMMELLTEKGYASEKAFAVARSTNRLRVPSSKANDAPIGAAPTVEWGYHVAPVLTVTVAGVPTKYVIDPSIFPMPVPLTTWVASMGAIADFRERNLADLQIEYANHTLPDENRYYTAPREEYFPLEHGGLLPGNEGAVKYNEAGPNALGRDRLMSYATDEEPVHVLAGNIRTAIAAGGGFPSIKAALYVIIAAADVPLRARLVAAYPNLVKEVRAIELGAKIRAVLDGPGTQDDKFHALEPIFAAAAPGVAPTLKILYGAFLQEMDAAIGPINSIMIMFSGKY